MTDPETSVPGPAPVELERLQENFTRLLRTPLTFGAGGVRADTRRYGAGLVAAVAVRPCGSAAASLAVYHRQYWLRLFDVMQREFALSARLIGLPHFYSLAQAYLLDSPPRGHDLGRAADGFVTWCALRADLVEETSRGTPPALLPQALDVDAAWRGIWSAAGRPALAPSAEQASELPRLQLQLAPTAAIVAEDWALVSLRRGLALDARANRLALPKMLEAKQYWLLFRTSEGIGQMALRPMQARLYTLCCCHALEEAVERLHVECEPEERTGLPARVQDWLALSMRLKLWVAPC